jgi:hypothetical protein
VPVCHGYSTRVAGRWNLVILNGADSPTLVF